MAVDSHPHPSPLRPGLYGHPGRFHGREEPPLPPQRNDTPSPDTSDDDASDDNGDDENSLRGPSLLHRRSEQSPQLSVTRAPYDPTRTNVLSDSASDVRPETPIDDDGYRMRHGWDSQYGTEQLRILATNFHMYFNDKRHERKGVPKPELNVAPGDWRMRDRLKTVAAALTVCLNIGVDPPDDFPKPTPSARLECWIDPTAATAPSSHNAMNQIGKALQTQYEQLSVRTRYKILPDPTVEETKKYCATLRKNAKDERILFHYNGHGVPKPTPSGEIWVFNKDYTQYIPIPLSDLQHWLGAPSLFVYDCSAAGLIVQNFTKFVEKYEAEHTELRRRDPEVQYRSFVDCIHLAACREDENLPTNPLLPADLFTSCLTTPIEIGVRFFLMRNPLPSNLKQEDVSRIPGRSQERRTPIGELNWIFTAITDTIAWNSLPKPLFKRLFRQDLMVAALFRNFLLAQRIMRIYNCHPQSYPQIPSTHDHPLWRSWDLAVEMVLAQLPSLKLAEEKKVDYQYQHSEFFYEQLTAFEVYLDHGAKEQQEPEQLPIVLQVLLSQVHRLRALVLLSRFLDLGPWAVELALSIGIFPYVLKLLQSQAVELKPPLVFIWARILAVDQSCQSDLLKDNGYQYFVGILHPGTGLPVRDVSEHRAMCAFIIAMFCRDFKQGQVVAHSAELVESCLSHVSLTETEHPLLRQWSCLCLSMLWTNFPDAKWSGVRSSAHLRLCELALDPVAEVRAAMIHALTAFIGIPEVTDQVAEIEEIVVVKLLPMIDDGSSLVRKELTIFLSTFVHRYQDTLVDVIFRPMEQTVRSYTSWEFPRLAVALGFEQPRQQIKKFEEATEKARNMGLPWAEWPERDPAWTETPDGASSWASKVNGRENKAGSSGTNSTEDMVGNGGSSQSLPRYQKEGPAIVFSTVWKHVVFLAADPDPEVASNATAIVDFIIEHLIEVKGSRAQLILEIMADLRDSRFVPPADPPRELFEDGNQTPSPAPSLYGEHLSFADFRDFALGSNSRSLVDLTNKQPSRPSSTAYGSVQRKDVLRSGQKSGVQINTREQSATSIPSHGLVPTSSRLRHSLDRHTIPLKSTFFDWSTEYFKEPQMRQTESDEPGSTDYNARLWRRNRNEKILETTQRMKEMAGSSRWDFQIGHFDNGRQPITMAFDQWDDHLVVADSGQEVRVWDYRGARLLNRFSNQNKAASEITGFRFINEDDQAMLMVGSSDGVLRLWDRYESPRQTRLVFAFRASYTRYGNIDQDGFRERGNLVFDWVQGRGQTLIGGDSNNIQIWGAGSEQCLTSYPTGAHSSTTSITTDQLEGHVFAAGFENGLVHVFDQRLRPTNAVVKEYTEHHTRRIANIHLQRGGQRELVSGSADGKVRLWDLRASASALHVATTQDGLQTLSVHEHAPVFAIGSERHNVKVFNMKGQFLSSFEPLGGFLHSNRSSAISTTAFHPHRMILACASEDDVHVTLYSCMSRKDNFKSAI